ncbi:MAG: iron ABC transporter permease [Pseudomonadota bacterium]
MHLLSRVKKVNPMVVRINGWDLGLLCIVSIVLFPIVTVFWIATNPTENIWPHLLATSLPRYLFNSVTLMGCVALFAIIIGVGTAWCVSRFTFPGRGVFQWALFLPLAVPSYIGAYAFVDFWEYAGPVQTTLRQNFGWSNGRDYWFFEPRSLTTAIIVIGLSLYPYVFMLARSAFQDQSSRVIEVAQALGASPMKRFWKVALPLARPAIAVGAALVMMESLNEFGAVEYFAVQTLTTGIFTVWLEANNLGGAAQIASVMLLIVAVLVVWERLSRSRMRVDQKYNMAQFADQKALMGYRAWLATLFCALPIFFGFLLPVTIMARHALGVDEVFQIRAFWQASVNSVWVAGIAGVLIVSAALLVTFAAQLRPSGLRRQLTQFSMLGYAIPGAILAIGVLTPLAYLDGKFADFVETQFGVDFGLILTGSSAGIILAYMIRFFALGVGTLSSALNRISPNVLNSARALGKRPKGVLTRVHIPMIRGPILIACLLVFVDAIKELPATLLLRPFGFETLSTLIYNSASREDIEGASLASLVVIMISMIAVLFVARASKHPNG